MSASPRRRILLVEDEWLIADAMQAMLTELGYTVVGPAPTVPDALRRLEKEAPDGAVLDVSLAATKSFEVAQALRSQGRPFLFVTGYTDADLPPEFQGSRVVRKPVSASVLAASLDQLFGGDPTDGERR